MSYLGKNIMLSCDVPHYGGVYILDFLVIHPEIPGCWGLEGKFIFTQGFCVGDNDPDESVL